VTVRAPRQAPPPLLRALCALLQGARPRWPAGRAKVAQRMRLDSVAVRPQNQGGPDVVSQVGQIRVSLDNRYGWVSQILPRPRPEWTTQVVQETVVHYSGRRVLSLRWPHKGAKVGVTVHQMPC
jgi:hypothetical protein